MAARLLRSLSALVVSASILTGGAIRAQPAGMARDPSPHEVLMVPVDTDVQLEVLAWGGSGRALVLLAGAGNTGHVFDEFAPRLAQVGRVYAITRRGYGSSSAPAEGYTVDRLGTDVRRVLDALELERPVLIGHSIAGQELSFLSTNHSSRLAGVVYLDGAYRYALHRPGVPETLKELRRKLELLEAELNGRPAHRRSYRGPSAPYSATRSTSSSRISAS